MRGRSAVSSLQGSTRSMPFLSFLGRETANLSSGSNTIPLTTATLLTELSSIRLVKLRNLTVKVWPTLSTTANVAFQLFIIDQATGLAVPVSSIKPISSVNQTVLRARSPFQNFVNSGDTQTSIQVVFYSTSTLAIVFDVQTRFLIAQDILR